MNDEYPRYQVDRAALRFHTPPGTCVPTLVEDFYDWASTRPSSSSGFFALAGGRLDEHWIEFRSAKRRASRSAIIAI